MATNPVHVEGYDFDEFLTAYQVAALWSSTDDDGDPFDDNYGVDDFSESAQNDMREDCAKFWNENHDLMFAASGDESQHGHDFWLTRNGHGAGFWDRGYGKLGDQLSSKAKEYGESYIYLGDDGQVWCY